MASPDLTTLKRDLDRLAASAHTPTNGLAAARATVKAITDARVYRTLPAFEAEILESHGYPDDAKVWRLKVKRLDEDIHADLLRLATCVKQLRVQRFQRFAAAMVIGIVALRHLFDPPGDGRPPPVLRSYIEECAFVSDEPLVPLPRV